MMNEARTRPSYTCPSSGPGQAELLPAPAQGSPSIRPTSRRRRLAIFNVKYSPNLGDGIIAECLEHALVQAYPELEPVPIDLAGRTGFDARYGRQRHRFLAIRELLPEPLRRRLMPLLVMAVVRGRLSRRWAERLVGCEAAIIGGGALLADADQNFPIKLERALQLCQQQKLPVAIASVGISDNWSKAGMRRLTRTLHAARLVAVTCRDAISVERWNERFRTSKEPRAGLAPDPGMLCKRVYAIGGEERPICDGPFIALGITDPHVLRLHGPAETKDWELHAWYVELARQLADAGTTVVLFTNGSSEDERFCDKVYEALGETPRVFRAPRFAQPKELARFIAVAKCVLAHRLHALIIAYSYGIPLVGFAWDRKLEAFFCGIERPDLIVDTGANSPASVAIIALQAIDNPPDPQRREELIAEAEAEVMKLGARLMHEIAA